LGEITARNALLLDRVVELEEQLSTLRPHEPVQPEPRAESLDGLWSTTPSIDSREQISQGSNLASASEIVDEKLPREEIYRRARERYTREIQYILFTSLENDRLEGESVGAQIRTDLGYGKESQNDLMYLVNMGAITVEKSTPGSKKYTAITVHSDKVRELIQTGRLNPIEEPLSPIENADELSASAEPAASGYQETTQAEDSTVTISPEEKPSFQSTEEMRQRAKDRRTKVVEYVLYNADDEGKFEGKNVTAKIRKDLGTTDEGRSDVVRLIALGAFIPEKVSSESRNIRSLIIQPEAIQKLIEEGQISQLDPEISKRFLGEKPSTNGNGAEELIDGKEIKIDQTNGNGTSNGAVSHEISARVRKAIEAEPDSVAGYKREVPHDPFLVQNRKEVSRRKKSRRTTKAMN
jgi:hypothetical protein